MYKMFQLEHSASMFRLEHTGDLRLYVQMFRLEHTGVMFQLEHLCMQECAYPRIRTSWVKWNGSRGLGAAESGWAEGRRRLALGGRECQLHRLTGYGECPVCPRIAPLMATGSQSAHLSTKLRAGSFENRERCGSLGCGADETPKVSQPPRSKTKARTKTKAGSKAADRSVRSTRPRAEGPTKARRAIGRSIRDGPNWQSRNGWCSRWDSGEPQCQ